METDIFGALHGVQNNKTKIRLRAPPDVETFTGHCHQYHSNLQRLELFAIEAFKPDSVSPSPILVRHLQSSLGFSRPNKQAFPHRDCQA